MSPRAGYSGTTRPGYLKAVPSPDDNRIDEPRCWKCGKMLAKYVGRPYQMKCPRCKVICRSDEQG